MEHTPRVLAVIIMDADGNRLVAKYYPVAAGGRTFQAGGETAYEKKLFRKTKHNHAAAVDSDARPPGVATTRETGGRRRAAESAGGHARRLRRHLSRDTFLYVVGAGHENELLLDTVLEGLFVALTILLGGSIESRASNLDIAGARGHQRLRPDFNIRNAVDSTELLAQVMLAVDELVDQGKILEVEPKTIANRVLMRGVDGTTTITDMSIRTP
ncbi:hypothetical protein JL722_13471 [Aureococcus anophagefferens]|nr:hypothetical protein JL722_13471 [Aureococcus anophagefferens]